MHTGGAAAPPLWRKRAGGRYMRQKAAQFSVGAAGYSALEIAVRGHTHWTMAVLGGLCAYPIGIWFMGQSAAQVAFYAYIIPFLISTAAGALLSAALLYALNKTGVLTRMQNTLD